VPKIIESRILDYPGLREAQRPSNACAIGPEELQRFSELLAANCPPGSAKTTQDAELTQALVRLVVSAAEASPVVP